MIMKKTRQRQGGMSLLEVLAAMSLFAIVAAGTGALAAQAMLRTAENRHAGQASMLVQQELERVRGLDYASIAAASQSKTMNGQSYTVATGVQANTPAPSMSTVTVTVSWTGAEGYKSYQVQTIYTDPNVASF
jgi:prepilin-type N-terminal cleavage/methylation domain-containing protein